jgi:tetratricopeptide (TPR) repeat protein
VPYDSAGIPYTDFGNSSAPSSLNDENSSASIKGTELATQFNQFAKQGEEAFRAGDYDRAVRAWRHAVVEEPKNASALIMLAQSLFAMARYDEAAGATQQAMMLLPEDQWLTTAKNSKSLYRNNREYLDQLSRLEEAVEKDPSDPALRLELGFQYALSDQQVLALRQLDKLIELVPEDQLGHKLRDFVAHKRMKASSSFSPSSSAASQAND